MLPPVAVRATVTAGATVAEPSAGTGVAEPEVQSAAFVIPVSANARAGVCADTGPTNANAATVTIEPQIELRLGVMHVLQRSFGAIGLTG